jgi:hypothetical protein
MVYVCFNGLSGLDPKSLPGTRHPREVPSPGEGGPGTQPDHPGKCGLLFQQTIGFCRASGQSRVVFRSNETCPDRERAHAKDEERSKLHRAVLFPVDKSLTHCSAGTPFISPALQGHDTSSRDQVPRHSRAQAAATQLCVRESG